jgi:hypothetical protein
MIEQPTHLYHREQSLSFSTHHAISTDTDSQNRLDSDSTVDLVIASAKPS